MQRGIPVIPNSINYTQIQANFNIFDFQLKYDEMALIDSIDNSTDAKKSFRIHHRNGSFSHSPYYPFHEEFWATIFKSKSISWKALYIKIWLGFSFYCILLVKLRCTLFGWKYKVCNMKQIQVDWYFQNTFEEIFSFLYYSYFYFCFGHFHSVDGHLVLCGF